MKLISNFGAHIVDYLAVYVTVFGCIFFLLLILNSPNSVTLTEEQFRCAETSSDGLGSKCDVYVRIIK